MYYVLYVYDYFNNNRDKGIIIKILDINIDGLCSLLYLEYRIF